MPHSSSSKIAVSQTPAPAPPFSARECWVNVIMAAILMLTTMPGRTQGLGLITEPLLKDLHIDRITYANINLWATLIGAVFCFPAGYLIDRFGLRLVAGALTMLLGVTVWGMSGSARDLTVLFILV